VKFLTRARAGRSSHLPPRACRAPAPTSPGHRSTRLQPCWDRRCHDRRRLVTSHPRDRTQRVRRVERGGARLPVSPLPTCSATWMSARVHHMDLAGRRTVSGELPARTSSVGRRPSPQPAPPARPDGSQGTKASSGPRFDPQTMPLLSRHANRRSLPPATTWAALLCHQRNAKQNR
jgi:hypothetical protein